MNCFRCTGWLVVIIAMVFVFAGNVSAAPKVVVVCGVGEANAARIGTFQPVFEGIKEGLKGANITPEYQFVELDLDNDDVKRGVGISAVAKALAAKPDLIIVLTDAALKYVGSQIDDIPVVFAYIWDKPEDMGLPKSNITGVTRASYAPHILAMGRRLTGAKTVALISKNNDSMQGVKHYLRAGADRLEQASGVKFMDMYLVDTFDQWAAKVNQFNAGMLYLADTSRVERSGAAMKDSELVHWTVQNARVPVIAAAEKDVQAGALFAIVTSEKAIGLSAAQTALKILGGTNPSEIPYVSSAKGKLVINTATAHQYGIQIPADILSSAEKIYD
ncbi:MAG: hypothetical protein VR64_21800 [Desulfatitalea sp. BRH_c12]|nr:MAG: hypothetical protein VR64_21800 [Desulfatitalea sp. BRH_c12]